MKSVWKGVFPAIASPSKPYWAQELPVLARDAKAMADTGRHGVIVLGTPGKNLAQTRAEKIAADAKTKQPPVGRRAAAE